MLLLQHPAAVLFLVACTAPDTRAEAFDTAAPSAAASLDLQEHSAPELELPRHPALSPDGSQVAFSHQGDLFVADVAGGQARRLTAHDAYDGRPKWSPDGNWLAYVSNRHGNWDLFVIPAIGGTPERLTWHSEGERLYGWIDSERLLIGAQRDRRYSRRDRGIWVAYRDGRTPTILGDWAAMSADLSRDQQTIVYERGHGDPSRRAYRGPASSALWHYDVGSGEHRTLTEFDGNDLAPMLSPDGKTVYFLSDRACEGNEEGRDLGLWKVATRGGRASLVYHPGGRSLRNAAMSGDGNSMVAELDLGLVRIDLNGGSASSLSVYGSIDPSDPPVHDRTVSGGASGITVAPDGDSIAFVATGDIYVMRKHDEIKRCVRVTTHPAPDYAPVWTEDGNALLFVSERDGNGELYLARVPGTAPVEEAEDGEQAEGESKEGEAQEGEDAEDSEKEEEEESKPFYRSRSFELTRLTETALDESQPSLSPDGKTLAWVVGLGDLVVGDPKTAEVRRVMSTGFEGPSYDWSPDSAWMVYSKVDDDFNYDVFLQRVDIEGLDASEPGVEPYNLTTHPDDDTGPMWSPDGRHIAFTSRRMMLDETDVWMVHLRAEDQERNKRERLEAAEEEAKAKKKAAKKDKGKKKEPAPEADPILSGVWSGMAQGSDPIPAGGLPFTLKVAKFGDKVVGDLESVIFSGPMMDPVWDAETMVLSFHLDIPGSPGASVELTIAGENMTGAAIVGEESFPLTAERTATDSGLSAPEQGEEAEEEEEEADPVVIDWDDLQHRVVRMTRREGNENAVGWSADSEKVYFNAGTGTRLTNGTTAESGFFSVDIVERKDDKVESSRVFSFTRHEKELLYVKGGQITGNSGKGKAYSFSVRYREDRRDVRREVVGEVWRALDRMFYDPEFHGHDWAASFAKWAPAASVASTPEDYGEMVNWMLGEMNASHMGYYSFGSSAARETDRLSTGQLGVLWDESFAGPGRKVADVLEGTPAARSISRLHVGDTVLSVNDEDFLPGDNWHRLMAGTTGQTTYLRVADAEGMEREVVIRPTGSINSALYRRFQEDCRAQVEEASGGRLGYLHIESMSTGPLVEFERELFAAGHGKDGLVIDVRENGGGWTTDMILAMLTVRDHAMTIPRGGGVGYPQGRRVFATWDKPIVVLCNENSYSNAEIFSWSIKTLGRGPIVGKKTYGAVISTGGTSLMDNSFVRLPFRGWYVNDQERTNMELNGCPPDFPVENLPGDYVLGVDRQLEKAIEVGLDQL